MQVNKTTLIALLLIIVLIMMSLFWTIWWWVWWIASMLLLIIWWFYVLVVWWDQLVSGAWSIAQHYKISPFIIWMSILAFGTSLPELFVNIIAAVRWESSLLIANVIWSNLSNLLLIWWVTAIIAKIRISKSTLFKEIPLSFLATLLLLILLHLWVQNWAVAILSQWKAWILLLWFILFIRQLINAAQNDEIEVETDIPKLTLKQAFLSIIWWIVWLYIWWEALVTYATLLAESLWVSTILIWASIIAFGTSVPELVTSIIAALKKNTDMAIWNIIWSNIFNILWIVWVTWLIQPIKADRWLFTDITVLLIVTLFLFLIIGIKKKKELKAREWVVFIILYWIYLFFLFYRW